MAVTRLKRKAKRNKQTSSIRRATIQQLTAKPVLKNVDVEAIKASFAAASKKTVTTEKEGEPKKEVAAKAPKAEATPVEKVKAEKKPAAKKPAAKKVAPKKEAKEKK